jgi:drug/metabolite transporter (DMT)-like permease
MKGITPLLSTFALLMFAANSLLCRMALGGGMVDAASYSTLRLVGGAVMLMMIAGIRQRGSHGGSAMHLNSQWGDRWSAFHLFLYAVPFSFAYNGLTTGTGALILFGSVQVTMLLAAWRSGERPSFVQWCGILIALAGLLYLLLPGTQAPPLIPALLMAVAGAAWGFYSLRGRSAGDPLLRTAGNFARAVPMVLIVSLVAWPSHAVNGKGALLALLSGAGASALGYVAWYAALKHLSATHAAALQLVVPIIAAGAGVLLLGESFGLRLGVATVLVLGGVGLTLYKSPAR